MRLIVVLKFVILSIYVNVTHASDAPYAPLDPKKEMVLKEMENLKLSSKTLDFLRTKGTAFIKNVASDFAIIAKDDPEMSTNIEAYFLIHDNWVERGIVTVREFAQSVRSYKIPRDAYIPMFKYLQKDSVPRGKFAVNSLLREYRQLYHALYDTYIASLEPLQQKIFYDKLTLQVVEIARRPSVRGNFYLNFPQVMKFPYMKRLFQELLLVRKLPSAFLDLTFLINKYKAPFGYDSTYLFPFMAYPNFNEHLNRAHDDLLKLKDGPKRAKSFLDALSVLYRSTDINLAYVIGYIYAIFDVFEKIPEDRFQEFHTMFQEQIKHDYAGIPQFCRDYIERAYLFIADVHESKKQSKVVSSTQALLKQVTLSAEETVSIVQKIISEVDEMPDDELPDVDLVKVWDVLAGEERVITIEGEEFLDHGTIAQNELFRELPCGRKVYVQDILASVLKVIENHQEKALLRQSLFKALESCSLRTKRLCADGKGMRMLCVLQGYVDGIQLDEYDVLLAPTDLVNTQINQIFFNFSADPDHVACRYFLMWDDLTDQEMNELRHWISACEDKFIAEIQEVYADYPDKRDEAYSLLQQKIHEKMKSKLPQMSSPKRVEPISPLKQNNQRKRVRN